MAVARALTEPRCTRVVELVTSGLPYEEAAAKVGYRSRSAAWAHLVISWGTAGVMAGRRGLCISFRTFTTALRVFLASWRT